MASVHNPHDRHAALALEALRASASYDLDNATCHIDIVREKWDNHMVREALTKRHKLRMPYKAGSMVVVKPPLRKILFRSIVVLCDQLWTLCMREATRDCAR